MNAMEQPLEIGVPVELTAREVFFAAQIGITRRLDAINKRRNGNNHGKRDENHWQRDIEGALAELALAKYLGIFWNGGHCGSDDVGPHQCRMSESPDNCLILHDSDPDEPRFYLVTGSGGKYIVRGWIQGKHGKRPEYWCEKVKGRPAYFVPQKHLLEPGIR